MPSDMIKVNSFDKTLKYNGKYLYKEGKKYTGTFFTRLNSGRTLCLNYDNGLLRLSSLNKEDEITTKNYKYNNSGDLTDVTKNGKDIFHKEITHNIGINYTKQEKINNIIGKTYDASKRLIEYVISPKLIFGFIKYLDDISIDTRYFLNKAKYLGNGNIQLQNIQGDPILNNGIVDKTIVRNLKNGSHTILLPENNNITGTYKLRSGLKIANINLIANKNGKPIWTRIFGIDEKCIYDNKVTYDDFGNKIREIYSECDGKWYIDNTFDKNGNIILSRKLNSSGTTLQTTKSKYDKNNLLIEEKVFNKENEPVEKTENKYYNNKHLKSNKVTYYDQYGSYGNLYEYDKDNNLVKFSEIYDDLILESYYAPGEVITKYIEKDKFNNIKSIKEYINMDEICIKTIVKKNENTELYHVEHLKKSKNEILKSINIFKTPEEKLLGKEFIITNNETGKETFIYTGADGKRTSYQKLCKIIDADI